MAGMWDEDGEKREKPEKNYRVNQSNNFSWGTKTSSKTSNQRNRMPEIPLAHKRRMKPLFLDLIVLPPTMLTVPPPPRLAFPDIRFEYGEPFQCPYCFTEQVVKNKFAWK